MSDVEVLQVQSELDWMVALYQERKPKRVLEIGTHMGGTLREWLQHAHVGTTVVAVDLLHQNANNYRRWVEPGVTLVTITGSSQAPWTCDAIKRFSGYHWVFIDGDHSREAVRADVFLALTQICSGGVILMHDIVGGDGEVYPPGQVLSDLENEYRVEHDYRIERIVHEGDGSPHGVGVVYP